MKSIQFKYLKTFSVGVLVMGLTLTSCKNSPVTSSDEKEEISPSPEMMMSEPGYAADEPETITLTGVIRDFKGSHKPDGHPDFERQVATCGGVQKGMVEETLEDDKPVYSGDVTCNSTSAERFNQWYNDVDGVNQNTTHDFVLELQNNGTYTFSKSSYFPIDNELFGNQELSHNYHFTTEIHTTFTYNGGETFSFIGDDDVWVFINDELVIDIGGIHGPEPSSVNLDGLNLTVGEDYSLDIFQAERQTTGSSFSFTTSLQLVSEDPEPVDDTPPSIEFSDVTNNLWPPNHKMHYVGTVNATDENAIESFEVTVSSNESANGKGDGNTSNDYDIVPNGEGFDVYVRAERSGKGSGRTYTVTATATDEFDNTGSDFFEVQVAKSQKGGRR